MNKWLKLHNDIVNDPKIRLLSFEDRWHFVALLCLKNDGTLEEPEQLKKSLLEVALGLSQKELESLKERLMEGRLISECWCPLAWDRRQGAKDKTAAERQKRFREKQKELKRYVTEGVTEPLRTEEEEEKEIYMLKTAPLNIPFDAFWKLCPRKRGKAAAEKKWPRLTNKDREDAVMYLRRNPYQDTKPEYIPYGSTILNQRPWEDEGDVPEIQSGGTHYR